MKFNKKGDIGFPEAIMSVMIVTIVLTLFLGAFVLNSNDGNNNTSFDDTVLQDFSITEDQVVFNGDIESYSQKNAYSGVTILCSVPGDIVNCDLTITCGTLDGDLLSDRFLITINADDGRSIPVLFEVAVCS